MFFSLLPHTVFQVFFSFFATFLLTAPVSAEDPATTQVGSTTAPELLVIDQKVLEFMARWNIPGATVALAKDDKLLYARGFGKADEDQLMQADHLFRIASLSKPITAMAIMKLNQDNGLDLEQKVFGPEGILNSELYADLRDPRMQEITIKHLLEHTAGWDRHISPEGDPMFNPVKIAEAMQVPAPADAVSVIRYVLQQPLDFAPGSRVAYSNIGYNILGRVIEQITELPYETYVQQAILQPLGITGMVLGRNLYENKSEREVKYFDLKARQVKTVSGENKKVPFPYGGFNLEAMDAHGGWIASAPDLIKLLMGLDPTGENALLSRETIARMTTPSNPDYGYAKGWFVNKKGNWWHSGALIGSSTLMAHLQDGMKWVLLMNARPEHPDFYKELDRLMWNATADVETWPEINLLEPAITLQEDQREHI
ncbi:beta-lactamase family protein [Adhaeribacter sp. BT258]|uniref:Beta-lactamase family protein n=1 Tax=Adhaeribacter terrigena TaxID=2793070 RepID=A0ABS1C1E7_9BACT|nr:serine hydrolase domain-containing protein [Adhaeribacter terrigena]MBK0402997.1 beta-lactamase family protein [Adhaeribacter terrigena]